jgi:hypothetical protein
MADRLCMVCDPLRSLMFDELMRKKEYERNQQPGFDEDEQLES